MGTQTGDVATAVQKARETRKRMRQLGAPEVGEVALLAAVFDLHLRLEALEKRAAAQSQERERELINSNAINAAVTPQGVGRITDNVTNRKPGLR